MMWWHGMPASGAFGYGWWAWHIIVVILVWVFLNALAVIALQRYLRPRAPDKNALAPEHSIVPPATILKERYARGEIGREEFIQKQRDLDDTG
jgi:putative membrane protein